MTADLTSPETRELFDQHVLDQTSIRAIAELACCDDGPRYRMGYQLEELLDRAGWLGHRGCDGGRFTWLSETLLARREEPGAIADFVRRLGHPLEYHGEPKAHQETVERLNAILALEGFWLTLSRATPVVLPLTESVVPREDGILRTSVSELIRDADKAALLQRRIDEALLCRESGAHLAAVVMMGSALEGVLLEALRERGAPGFNPQGNHRLVNLIDTCHAQGWIQADAKRFSHELREYRNLVHTDVETRIGHFPDADTARICWYVVVAALNDLADVLGSAASQTATT